MGTPQHIHCAECLEVFHESNPQGRIFTSDDSEVYHLEDDNTYFKSVCDIDLKNFEHSLGTFGVELGEYELTNRRLIGKQACYKCFTHVW